MFLTKIKKEPKSPFESLWADFFNDDFGFMLKPVMSTRQPAVNVVETDENYRIDVAAPGFSKDDFRLQLNGNILTISGEKKDEASKKEQNYSMCEFNYTSFSRSFTLPESIKGDKISAEYADGILKITLPKKDEVKPKAIEIKVS